MARINGGRVLLGGLVAGIVWTLLSSLVTVVVGQDFAASVPGNKLSVPSGGLVAFLLKTAVVAGFSWWVLSSLIDATWGSFGFVSARALLGPMAASLPAIIVAALAGAWFSKE